MFVFTRTKNHAPTSQSPPNRETGAQTGRESKPPDGGRLLLSSVYGKQYYVYDTRDTERKPLDAVGGRLQTHTQRWWGEARTPADSNHQTASVRCCAFVRGKQYNTVITRDTGRLSRRRRPPARHAPVGSGGERRRSCEVNTTTDKTARWRGDKRVYSFIESSTI
jgi:hypothetical protein